jgi:hypothetical protein
MPKMRREITENSLPEEIRLLGRYPVNSQVNIDVGQRLSFRIILVYVNFVIDCWRNHTLPNVREYCCSQGSGDCYDGAPYNSSDDHWSFGKINLFPDLLPEGRLLGKGHSCRLCFI